jgi:hypothetical protein
MLRWRTEIDDRERFLIAAVIYFVAEKPEEEVFEEMLTAPLHPLGLLIIFLEPLTGAASPLRPCRQPGEVWAHRLLDSPTPNTKKYIPKSL